jgi:hypothetical protein
MADPMENMSERAAAAIADFMVEDLKFRGHTPRAKPETVYMCSEPGCEAVFSDPEPDEAWAQYEDHQTSHDIDNDWVEIADGPDPVDEPMVWDDGRLRGGLPGEEVGGCCGMPVARVVGVPGEWGHTRQGVPPGGHHQARPVVSP